MFQLYYSLKPGSYYLHVSYLVGNIESLDGGVDDELVIGGYDTRVIDSPHCRSQD